MNFRSKHWTIYFGKRELWWADSSINIDHIIAFLQKSYPTSFYLSQHPMTGHIMLTTHPGARDL